MRESEKGGALGIVLVIIALVGVSVVSFIIGQKTPTVALGSDSPTQIADGAANTDPKTNPVLAKLNGEEIRRQDVVKLINTMPAQMKQIPIEQLFPMALEQTISNKIIDKKAANAGLENDPDVKKQLAQAREQFVRGKFIENAIDAKLTDERLKASYDGYVFGFPDVQEVKAAHILVEDEKTAKDLIGKLNKGDEFATLAKENSKDGSAETGGELGYFAQNEVVPEFAEAAFALEVGAYTKKPVKSQFGYHIIRIDEKRKRPPAEFDVIQNSLKQELQREILNEVLTEWKEAANIERFDINGKPLPEAEEPAAGDAAPEPSAPEVENAAE